MLLSNRSTPPNPALQRNFGMQVSYRIIRGGGGGGGGIRCPSPACQETVPITNVLTAPFEIIILGVFEQIHTFLLQQLPL